MATKLRRILTIVILLLFFLLPAFFKTSEEKSPAEQKEMIYNISQVVLVGHEEGERQWVLKVRKVAEQGQDVTLLTGIEDGEVYDEGEIKYFLTADRGSYERKKDFFTLQDNVFVTSNDGEILKTDQLDYDQQKKEMTTGIVEIKTKNVLLTADQLSLDVDKEIYDFSGEVFLEFTIGDVDQERNGGMSNEKTED